LEVDIDKIEAQFNRADNINFYLNMARQQGTTPPC
jgi:hypothetical protein